MKKTMNIDAGLLARARKASGASTDTETVRLGLEELARREVYAKLNTFWGSEPDALERQYRTALQQAERYNPNPRRQKRRARAKAAGR